MSNPSHNDMHSKKKDESVSQVGVQTGNLNPLTHIVTKIRDEPLLLVVAIVILLAGLATAQITILSEDFRTLVLAIAFIVVAIVAIRYIYLGFLAWLEYLKDIRQPRKPVPIKPDNRTPTHHPERSTSGLASELARREKNLAKLYEQAATYPAGQVPIHIQNKIEDEENRINEIRTEIKRE